MNLTISVDNDLLRRARELARRRGVSLQVLLRDYLRTLVSERPGEAIADELITMMDTHGGRSGGRRITREEAYEGRV